MVGSAYGTQVPTTRTWIKNIIYTSLLTIGIGAQPLAGALDINGEGSKTGIAALYLFNNTTGPVVDSSGVGTPLNLTIGDPARVTRENGYLRFNQPTIARSGSPATKIINACKASNALTVEAYVRVSEDNQNGPARMITLSRDSGTRNFTVGQTYDGVGHWMGRVRTGTNNQGSLNGFESPDGVLQENALHHVVMVKDGTTARLYVDRQLQATFTNLGGSGSFANWDDSMEFAFGNELSYQTAGQERPWLGELHMVAVFCRALTAKEIQGDTAVQPGNVAVMPKPDEPISDLRQKAAVLYHRLGGTRVPIDHPVLDEMEALMAANQYVEAAKKATASVNFYNITVRDFAAQMATRDETMKAPLSDFVATVVGVTRDGLDARLLVSGDFYYKADPTKAAVPQNVVQDILLSNRHYESLASQGYSLARVLHRVNGQPIMGANGAATTNPDPAGILTSRAFLEAHADAGTNRRLVEFAFREFLCVPIEQWADTSNADSMVGRDVDRYPGGSNAKYQAECKGCHAGMDAIRPAFGQLDFENNRVKHGLSLADGNGENQMKRNPAGISDKLNVNNDVFPDGYAVNNTAWINQLIRGSNLKYFGWRGKIQGAGLNSLGTMIGNSQAFSRCMVRRVYSSLCKREPTLNEGQMILTTADEFEKNNYNLKWLFERVAVQGACLGN